MRFAYVSSAYTQYVRAFYAKRPSLASAPFLIQEQALIADCFGWFGSWPDAMRPLGYEARDFIVGVAPLERAWLSENRAGRAQDVLNSAAIGVERLVQFQPEVIFFDHHDPDFLQALKERLGSIVTIGWEGSALGRQALWPHLDLVLSCAPESVDAMRAAGARAAHLNHAFNAPVAQRVGARSKNGRATFIGQLTREGAFHLQREAFLEQLCSAELPLDIHSPSHDFGMREDVKALTKMVLFVAYQSLARVPGISDNVRRLPYGYLGDKERHFPRMPVSRILRDYLKPACFGFAMYERIAESLVCLNIHADSSPRFASNARLFETTGVGTCLLTDARSNLAELFVPGKEVVVYESAADCVEKMEWLIAHPQEAHAIAAAGQARTLRDHTFANRAEQLHAHISHAMASR